MSQPHSPPQSTKVFRLDRGTVSSRPFLTADGILLCDAVFARDGVLEYDYIDEDGRPQVRRELRLPEENQKALTGFGLASVTIEHPEGAVDPINGDALRHGISLAEPRYEIVEGKGGFVRGQIAVLTNDARTAIARGVSEISTGYECWLEETPGEWLNPATGRAERYDGIQRDIIVNHHALTRRGRAGPEVRAMVDSMRSQPKPVRPRYDMATQSSPTLSPFSPPAPTPVPSPKPMETTLTATPMATLQLPGGTIALPMDVFAVIKPILDDRDRLLKEVEMLSAPVAAEAGEALSMVTQDIYDKEKDRADSLSVRLTNAEGALAKLGFKRRGDSYISPKARQKSRRDAISEDLDDGMNEDMEEDELTADEDLMLLMEEEAETVADMDDDGMNEDMEEDELTEDGMKKKADSRRLGKNSRKDAIAARANALFRAYKDAETLCPGISTRLDSVESVTDVRREVVAQHYPDLNLDSKAAGFVDGLYQSVVANYKQAKRSDSAQDSERRDYTSELSAVTKGAARADSRTDSRGSVTTPSAQRRMNNYKKPLTATKQR